MQGTATANFAFMNPVEQEITRSTEVIPRSVLSSASTGFHQDLNDFFAKPFLCDFVNWAVAHNVNDDILGFNIYDEFVSNPAWTNKVHGFRSMRATAVIRVTLSATPFQQGALLLYYMPNYTSSGAMYLSHQNNITGKSQLPGIRMQCCHNEAILRIPYVAPTTHLDLLRDDRFDWGRFVITVMSPLATGAAGSQTAKISVFLSFEDVELEGPIFPQAGSAVKVSKFRSRVRKKKSNITEQEAAAPAAGGPLAQTFSGLASLAGKAMGIPVLSPIAKPAAWVFNVGKDIASYLGWSKPLDETTLNRVAPMFHALTYNCDGKDISQPLGLSAQNKVQVLPNVPGYDFDEMSFDFIKAQWAYLDQGFTVGIATVDTIGYIDLCPDSFLSLKNVTLSNDNYEVVQHTPVSFLASHFNYYRGSFKIKFRFIKTEFHAATIAIAYNPYYGPVNSATIDNEKMNLVHHEIVDIQQVDEMTLEFPYSSPYPYLRRDQPYGRVYLYVVNELKVPNTVSQNINILWEVAGCSDLEFAVPNNYPTQPIVTQGGVEDDECVVEDRPIGNSSNAPDSSIAASVCIGEKIVSALQLMKAYSKFVLIYYAFAGNVFGTAAITTTSGAFNPHMIGSACCIAAEGGLDDVPIGSGIYGDFINSFAACYAYRRGSVRIRLATDPTASTYNVALVAPPKYNTISNASDTLTVGGQLASFSFYPGTNSGLVNKRYVQDVGNTAGFSVQVPFYSQFPFILNDPVYCNTVAGETNYPPPTLPKVELQYRTNSTATPSSFGTLQRAAGDDFQLCYWIGVPLMLKGCPVVNA